MYIYIFLILILILSLIYSNFYKSKRYYHMLQQNLYNENNRYLKWIFRNSKQFFDIDLINIGISLVGIFVIFDLELISNILILISSIVLILIGKKWNRTIKNDQNKKKLVVTARIKRLIMTTTILYLIPIIILGFNIYNSQIVWIIILMLNIMTYLNSFVTFIAMIINTPIEKCVYLYYKTKAYKKIPANYKEFNVKYFEPIAKNNETF